MAKDQTYRLGSSPMVGAPGVIAWAKNGYVFKKDREYLLNVITSGWGIPQEAAHALLNGDVDYTVEDGAVVFTIPGDDEEENQELDHNRHNLLSGVMDNR